MSRALQALLAPRRVFFRSFGMLEFSSLANFTILSVLCSVPCSFLLRRPTCGISEMQETGMQLSSLIPRNVVPAVSSRSSKDGSSRRGVVCSELCEPHPARSLSRPQHPDRGHNICNKIIPRRGHHTHQQHTHLLLGRPSLPTIMHFISLIATGIALGSAALADLMVTGHV